MNCKKLMLLALPLALLASCSAKKAAPGSSSDTVISNLDGQFIDSPVEGLNYSSASVTSGVTGTNGSFKFDYR